MRSRRAITRTAHFPLYGATPIVVGDGQRFRRCTCGAGRVGPTGEMDAWWVRHRSGLPEPVEPAGERLGPLSGAWRSIRDTAVTVHAAWHLRARRLPTLPSIAALVALASLLVDLAAAGERERTIRNHDGQPVDLIRSRRGGRPGWLDVERGKWFPVVSGAAGVDRFWVGGTGTWDAATTTHWAATTGGAGGATAPTVLDRAFIDANSGGGTITISAPIVKAVDCTDAPVTTIDFASSTLTVGSSVGGAFKLSANITVANTAGTLVLQASSDNSGAGWAITTAGKALPATNFFGAGGKWTLQDAFSTGTNTLTLTQGTLDTNGVAVTTGTVNSTGATARTLTLGATAWASSGSWNLTGQTNLTLTANTSTITLNGAGVTFGGGTITTYNSIALSGSGAVIIGSGFTCVNLTRTGTAVKTDALTWNSSSVTVTGTLAFVGNAATNRLLVQSNTRGTARTITLGASAICKTGGTQHVDFMDITLAGGAANERDLSAITGNSGDCGGNSGITFTNAATQTATGTASFTWSTHGWTTRVPLPQDNVSIPNAFVATRVVTVDMPRLGADITMTCTGSPTLTNTVANESYGSWTLVAGVAPSGTNTWTLAGRGIHTLTSAGATFTQALTINGPSGTYTQQDALIDSRSATAITITNGTYVDGGQTVTLSGASGAFVMTGGTLTKTGAWSFSTTGAVTFWNVTGGTVTASGGITLTAASANNRTFAGNGNTYGTLTYTVAGSTGPLLMTGSNTFAAINFSDATNARTLTFTAGTTTTITALGGFDGVRGTAGKLMTLNSTAGGTPWTLAVQNGRANTDYLSIRDSAAAPTAYAGANSTNVSGNTGWVFAAPPPLPIDRGLPRGAHRGVLRGVS